MKAVKTHGKQITIDPKLMKINEGCLFEYEGETLCAVKTREETIVIREVLEKEIGGEDK